MKEVGTPNTRGPYRAYSFIFFTLRAAFFRILYFFIVYIFWYPGWLLIHLFFSGGQADPYFWHFLFFLFFWYLCGHLIIYLFIYLPWPGGLLIYLFIHCGLVECSFIYWFLSHILAGSSFLYSEPAPLHLGTTGFHQIDGNCSFIHFLRDPLQDLLI